MGDSLLTSLFWIKLLLLENCRFAEYIFLSETLFTFHKDAFYYCYATNYTFIFVLKLSLCLVFLSAIRGGVPRYRYDFLTKMGWVKFLGLVLSVFMAVVCVYLIV